MFAQKGVFSSIGRAAVIATAAAVMLTAVEPSLAQAASAPARKGLSVAATSTATDFSARCGRRVCRHRRDRSCHRGNPEPPRLL